MMDVSQWLTPIAPLTAADIDAAHQIPAQLSGMGVVLEFALIGSASFMPPEQCNDIDFAVMLQPGHDAIALSQRLIGEAFATSCSDYDTQQGAWAAVRIGRVNLMLTHDRKFYDGYRCAMEVIKYLKLTNKADRVAVCHIVRDGLTAQTVKVLPAAPTP